MAESMVIPVGIDEAEEFGQRTPIAPPGWNRLRVTRVEAKQAQGKPIHEVFFDNANGEEARRGFFLHAEAIGFYLAFLRIIAPDVPKYAGLPANFYVGRSVDGLVKHATRPWTNKKGESIQITNADVDVFRPAMGAAPAPSGNGSAPSGATGTSTPPPAPPPSTDLPF